MEGGEKREERGEKRGEEIGLDLVCSCSNFSALVLTLFCPHYKKTLSPSPSRPT
jgi:hypothetical protein